ncbi:unnamed protein product, partial [Didymodactylos carnosus]
MDWTGLRSPYGALVCTLRTAEISSGKAVNLLSLKINYHPLYIHVR